MRKLKHAILYLSDLYVVVMVIGWIVGIVFFGICAAYDLAVHGGTAIFSELATMITTPATAGGALWLIRCCVNHYKAPDGDPAPDFPNVNTNEGGLNDESIFGTVG